MRVLVVPAAQDVASIAAQHLKDVVTTKPAAVLGLATGATPVQTYRKLIDLYQHGKVSFRDVTTFNLDEYIGMEPDHPGSFRAFMQAQLFDRIDIERCNTHLPFCRQVAAANDHALMFEEAIAGAGGIDCQLLGIGVNGHIGFNEPYSSLASRTRVKTLTRQTITDNRQLFAPEDEFPTLAMTMGIGTILEAKEILLLAVGEHKAPAIRQAIEGPVQASCPASALQMHPRVTFIVDEAAAQLLSDTDYFNRVLEHEAAASGHAVGFGPIRVCT